jgi:hypothetical protein
LLLGSRNVLFALAQQILNELRDCAPGQVHRLDTTTNDITVRLEGENEQTTVNK